MEEDMFIKYNRNNVSLDYLSLEKEKITMNDFVRRFQYSDLIPLKNNNQIMQFVSSKNIYIVTAIYNCEISSDFFFRLIKSISKSSICMLYNEYHELDEMNEYLTKKYTGNILCSMSQPEVGFLKLNDSLIDNDSIFDWYNLWGHGFNGWILNNNQMDFFKNILSNIGSNNVINIFLNSSFIKIEFGDIHESIRFITFDENKANEIKLQIQNFKLI